VSDAFGKPDIPAADLVAGLVDTLGLPGRLAEVGVGKDRFRETAEKSMHDRAVLNNPRPIKSPAEVMEILELAA
jgi:maleylacetate reductase